MALVRSFSVHIQNEPHGSKVSDIAGLDDGVIIVADSLNYVVKAFSIYGDYIFSTERFAADEMFGHRRADENADEYFGLLSYRQT